ncbi:hypothetical protein PFISCL1PPCAC_9074 [Pristionchus fissidentatus]|uniref:Uncharacterized protein n=1 Tax=Pristionchus fissidentatus TaxID=1538716 RepID=A0AAV5VGD3_9BILA|nr:hypothetical protein PFISCL1PPCAC_9074 [Pristionchus fissidentatus]
MSPSAQTKNKLKRQATNSCGMDLEMRNQLLQIAEDGSEESNELMIETRKWRVSQGRANLAATIAMIRQIVEWPALTINDAESMFGILYAHFKNEFPLICEKVDKLFYDRAPAAVKNCIKDCSPLKSFLTKLAAVLDTIKGKRKSGDPVTSVYREFTSCTVEEAMKVISSKKGKTNSRIMDPFNPRYSGSTGTTISPCVAAK